MVVRRGLFNPFTMSGDIVVNGVLASAHSDWLLDAVMPNAWAHRLPAIYQVCQCSHRHADFQQHYCHHSELLAAHVLRGPENMAACGDRLHDSAAAGRLPSISTGHDMLVRPMLLQVLMAPARLMYKMLGAEAVRRADAVVGFAKLAGGNGGGVIGFLQAHAALLQSAAL